MSFRTALLLFGVGTLAACGGDDNSSPSTASLAGVWNATRFEFVDAATPTLTFDIVAQGGTVTLDLGDTGGFVLTVTMPGEPDVEIRGSWTHTKDTMTLTEEGAKFSWQFDMALGNDRLTLAGAHVLYDVDGDGTEQETILGLQLVRN